MTILGNRNRFIEEEEDNEGYTLPAMYKSSEDEPSFKKAVFLSAIMHPTVVGVAWLLVFILALMGITFTVFEKQKPKTNDIEFVLVDNLKEQKPTAKTNFRSDKNTRSGGKRDPKRKVSMPSPSPTKKAVQQRSVPGPKAHKVGPKKSTTKPKSTTKSTKPSNFIKSMMQKSSQQARPQPPSARPSVRPSSVPRPTARPSSKFAVSVPKGGTKAGSYSTGPIGGHGTSKTGGSSSGGKSTYGGSGHYAPVPSLSPSSGGGGTGSRLSRGGSGYGNAGNPSGGGGAPGINSVREPDFGPYMRELQRRIKMNWDPPKGNESKRVVLIFKIAKDGRLLSLRVFKSSGIPNADKAALHAVELTAPFRRLPPEFKGSSIDIQFTFDYNVFGAKGY